MCYNRFMNNEIQPEIEATFINIDKQDLRNRIRAAGGELLLEETKMRRVVFDTGEHSFARVRDEGNKVTMSYKYHDSLELGGAKEICLTVDNYDEAVKFVKALGIKPKAEQETLREEWLLDGVEIDIDTWPWIPTFVEIEGPTNEKVVKICELLGFTMKDAIYGSVDEVYKKYFDVTSNDINYMPEIKFTEIPSWLEAKRRK